MTDNPVIHHRRSIRLKDYDYSQEGMYFITICTQDHEYFFGEIAVGKMLFNEAGKMIEKWYFELMNKFPDMRCDEHVVMPNHFHCIIHNVGADLRVCPEMHDEHTLGKQTLDEHKGSPLRNIVQWFKTMTTNEYIRNVKQNGWQPFNGKLWQRNYYERITRNEKALTKIREYILNNPLKWDLDKENLQLN